jgi:outer membrane receptor protein involved in Fe transport
MSSNKSGLLTLGISAIAVTAMIAFPAHAQSAGDEAATASIVVTGSRIARPDQTSNSPISVVSGDVLKEQGAVNVEEALNQLPQITPGLNANVNNGGNGTVTVDVRGLGSSRTLVLVNSRRMVPSTNTGVVDLNVINPLLIERVEVVTGGASAAYGSDALGGVVNFILKDKFEGVELSGQYGLTERGDSETWTLGGIVGGNFADDRGNATLGVSFTKRGDSFQSEREWSRIDQNGGSATGVTGRFDNLFNNTFATGGNRAFNTDGSVRPFVNSFDLTTPATDRYNFAPVNYIQTPQERFTMTALANYDINDAINVYAEGSYVNSKVDLQLAPTPATNIFVNANSPMLSPSALALAAGRADPNATLTFRRRMVEVGPRIQNYNFDVTQLNFGARGKLFDGWDFDVYYGRGRVESAQGLQNDVSRSRLTSGLNGCPTGSPAGCVRVDAFGAGRITTAAANYIRIASAVDTFTFDRDNVVASANGKLGTLPGGDIRAAVGVEYRRDASDFVPSDPAQTGDLTGFNAVKPISGSFNTKEVFGEVSLPVVDMLTLAAKGRYSDYSSVGGNFTWSVEGDFRPVDDIRLRGTYSRAARAPSVFELFQAGDQGFPVVEDPCFRGQPQPRGTLPAPSAGVSTICTLQGLPNPTTNILVQTNSQIEGTFVGSTNLKAEEAETLTGGLQFTPTFVPGFSLSVDYFDIKVDGYVSRIQGGTSGLVTACFAQNITSAAQLAADPYCRLLSRRPNGDLLATVPLTNEASLGVNNVLKTRGIDFAAGYDFALGGESKLGLSSNVTYLMDYKFNGDEFARLASADFGTLPTWKANTRVTYRNDDFSLSLNWQYFGKVTDTGSDETIKAQNYFDLNARFNVSDSFEFFGGVQNLLDKQPPPVYSGSSASNTDEVVYDTLGRRYFMGAKISF